MSDPWAIAQIVIGALNVVVFILLTRRQITHLERSTSTQDEFAAEQTKFAAEQLKALRLQIEKQDSSSMEQVEALRTQIQTQYDSSRGRFALDFSISRNRNIIPSRQVLDDVFKHYIRESKTVPFQVIEEAYKSRPDVYSHIRTVLAHYEVLAVAIDCDLADNDVARDLIAETMFQYMKVFQEFMERRRIDNPRAYEYMNDLERRWKEEIADKQRKRRTGPRRFNRQDETAS